MHGKPHKQKENPTYFWKLPICIALFLSSYCVAEEEFFSSSVNKSHKQSFTHPRTHHYKQKIELCQSSMYKYTILNVAQCSDAHAISAIVCYVYTSIVKHHTYTRKWMKAHTLTLTFRFSITLQTTHVLWSVQACRTTTQIKTTHVSFLSGRCSPLTQVGHISCGYTHTHPQAEHTCAHHWQNSIVRPDKES